MDRSALIILTVVVVAGLLVTLVLTVRMLHSQGGGSTPPAGSPARPDVQYTLESPPTALEGRRELLHGLAVPCVSLTARPVEEPLPPLASKLGGRPGLQSITDWPRTRAGAAMTFLGQINLEEVARSLAGTDGPQPGELPPRGLLLFFYDMEEQVWGYDPEDRAAWRCIWLPEPEEPTGELTVPVQAEAPRLCALSFAPAWSLPDEYPESLDEREADAYLELQLSMQPSPAHQLLGFPTAIQGDPRFEAQMGSNGVYCGDGSVQEHPRYQELTEGVEDWRLLWQLDSDDAPGWMWGDAGMLYLLVRNDDLEAGHLDRIWVVGQCY